MRHLYLGRKLNSMFCKLPKKEFEKQKIVRERITNEYEVILTNKFVKRT